MSSINLKACYISMVSLFILMVMTTINTILRKTGIGSITDNLDITEYLLVMIIYCAMAYLESEKGHVRVDMFLFMLPKMLCRIVEAFWYVLSAGILGFFTYSLFINIGRTYASGATTQVYRIPQWPFVAILCFVIFLYTVTVVLHLIEIVTRKNESEEEQAKEDPA